MAQLSDHAGNWYGHSLCSGAGAGIPVVILTKWDPHAHALFPG